MIFNGSLRIKSCKQEVKQETYGLLHVDLVSGWHPFVELVENGGEYSLQAGHIEFCVGVQVVQGIFPQSFYHIPNVYQVHYNQRKGDTSMHRKADATLDSLL